MNLDVVVLGNPVTVPFTLNLQVSAEVVHVVHRPGDAVSSIFFSRAAHGRPLNPSFYPPSLTLHPSQQPQDLVLEAAKEIVHSQFSDLVPSRRRRDLGGDLNATQVEEEEIAEPQPLNLTRSQQYQAACATAWTLYLNLDALFESFLDAEIAAIAAIDAKLNEHVAHFESWQSSLVNASLATIDVSLPSSLWNGNLTSTAESKLELSGDSMAFAIGNDTSGLSGMGVLIAQAVEQDVQLFNQQDSVRFATWLNAMEMDLAERELPCIGFRQCMLQTVQDLVGVFLDGALTFASGVDAGALETNLTLAVSLLRNLTMSPPSGQEALAIYQQAHQLLVAALENDNLVCGTPPAISGAFEERYTAVLDQPFELVCEAEGAPAPHIYWVADGDLANIVSGTAALSWQLAAKSNQGVYTCVASNHMDVAVGPSVAVRVLGNRGPTTEMSYRFDVSLLNMSASGTREAFEQATQRAIAVAANVPDTLVTPLTVDMDGTVTHGFAVPTEAFADQRNASVASVQQAAYDLIERLVITDTLSVDLDNGTTLALLSPDITVVVCPVPCSGIRGDEVFGEPCSTPTFNATGMYGCEELRALFLTSQPLCREAHELSGYAAGTVYCRRVNDPPDIFNRALQPTEVEMNENEVSNGTALFTFQLYDPQLHSIEASLVNGSNASFSLTRHGSAPVFSLWVIRPFDYETSDRECAIVRAADRAGESPMHRDLAFCVTVRDVDEHPFDIRISVTSLAENPAHNATLATVTAQDDAGEAIAFALVDDAGMLGACGGGARAGGRSRSGGRARAGENVKKGAHAGPSLLDLSLLTPRLCNLWYLCAFALLSRLTELFLSLLFPFLLFRRALCNGWESPGAGPHSVGLRGCTSPEHNCECHR